MLPLLQDKRLGISVRVFGKGRYSLVNLVFRCEGFETRITLDKKSFRQFCKELRKTGDLKALLKVKKEESPEEKLLRGILGEGQEAPRSKRYFYSGIGWYHIGKPKLSVQSLPAEYLTFKEKRAIQNTGIAKDFSFLGWFGRSLDWPVLVFSVQRDQFLKLREYCLKVEREL